MPLQDEQLSAVRARKPKRLPKVLSRSEAVEVNEPLQGTHKLVPSIMYGSGLRVLETLRRRVFGTCPIFRSMVDVGKRMRCVSAPGRSTTPTYPDVGGTLQPTECMDTRYTSEIWLPLLNGA